MRRLAFRWTIGAVGDLGFESLRLSLWGAWRLFGSGARYLVCVNHLPLDEARRRTGEVPPDIGWRDNGSALPDFLRSLPEEARLWRLTPGRCFPDDLEISLDNDCVLWDLPAPLASWMRSPSARCLLARDGEGLRALPPGFDFEAALRAVLLGRARPSRGAEAEWAALSILAPPTLIGPDEIAARGGLGRAGVHFEGLNRDDDEARQRFLGLRDEIMRLVGLLERSAA